MTRATYLAAYETWARGGRGGLAPSAPSHGVMSCDMTPEICAIDDKLRDETGLSSWAFYDPKRKVVP